MSKAQEIKDTTRYNGAAAEEGRERDTIAHQRGGGE